MRKIREERRCKIEKQIRKEQKWNVNEETVKNSKKGDDLNELMRENGRRGNGRLETQRGTKKNIKRIRA